MTELRGLDEWITGHWGEDSIPPDGPTLLRDYQFSFCTLGLNKAQAERLWTLIEHEVIEAAQGTLAGGYGPLENDPDAQEVANEE